MIPDQLRFARLEAEFLRSALELAVSEIRELLRERPDLTGSEVVAALEAEILEGRGAGARQEIFDEKCVRCGRELVVRDDYVTHVSADGGLNRGCRAVSFVAGEGWDERLSPRWSAKRPKG